MFKLKDVGQLDKMGDVYISLVTNECLLHKFGWQC